MSVKLTHSDPECRALSCRWAQPASCLLHCLAVILLFVRAEFHPAQVHHAEHAKKQYVKLFLPQIAKPIPEPENRLRAMRASAAVIPVHRLSTPVESKIDLSMIRLAFDEDLGNQLPDVVRAHGGILALVDKADPNFAQYVIEPPDWIPRKTLIDISGRLRFSMTPPEKWPLLRDVAERNLIPLSKYDVCALFPRIYGRCLQDAIRDRSGFGNGEPVQSARLAFESSSHCGVKVLEVGYAPKTRR